MFRQKNWFRLFLVSQGSRHSWGSFKAGRPFLLADWASGNWGFGRFLFSKRSRTSGQAGWPGYKAAVCFHFESLSATCCPEVAGQCFVHSLIRQQSSLVRWKGHSLLNQPHPGFKHWLCHLPAAWPRMLGKGGSHLNSKSCWVGSSVLPHQGAGSRLSSRIRCLALPLICSGSFASHWTLQDLIT